MVKSHGLTFTSSLNLRSPEKANRQAAVSLTFDNVGCLFVSATNAFRMSTTVIGSFLVTGLAKALLSPSNVLVTREFLWVGEHLLNCAPMSLSKLLPQQ